MQRDRAAVARTWYRTAQRDLSSARALLVIEPSLSAFHAQQGAEKALKALLVATTDDHPRTHTAGRLIRELRDADPTIDESLMRVEYEAPSTRNFFSVVRLFGHESTRVYTQRSNIRTQRVHKRGTMIRLRATRLAVQSALLVAFTAAARSVDAAPLVALPTPAESFDVGSLHVDRYGSGARVLVLIPGLDCGPWAWGSEIAHFGTTDTIYALTLPGFDGRPATAKKPLVATFVRDFSALLDRLPHEKPVVVGHSLGGMLAIDLAESMPQRLAGVVAVDGLPVFPTLVAADAAKREEAAAEVAAPYAGRDAAGMLAGSRDFMTSYGTADPALIEPTAALEAKSDPAATGAWIRELFETDLRPGLAKATVPLLEVVPYYAPDHEHPPLQYTQEQTVGFYQSLLAGAPHASAIAISRARHFAMLDRPADFDTALASFIATLPAP